MPEQKTASGYLHQDFRLFHLKDKKNITFPFHYHDFNKIIVFLSGNVTYLVEGKAYFLKPLDILLIGRHDIHKPIIDSQSAYERIVIWINNDFLKSDLSRQTDISKCFDTASSRSLNLIRLDAALQNKIRELLHTLEHSLQSEEYGSDILSHTYFLQLMVYLNRIFADPEYRLDTAASESNQQMDHILSYLNTHYTQELQVASLAEHFYLSPSYLMHKFKAVTGYTLHQYIIRKRLLSASKLIQSGTPVMKASAQCGFSDYSSFSRAFKKMFGCPPRDYFRA
ncbi:MAG: AraC family transcriptional regulator [Eubacterium sp.]|jgi:AraC-type DNA-binding domain-containing proteins|nr:AraC family transcriptional regulator [Eubacterium sp.]